eukprot:1728502-Amphidinium_carterae.1
MTLHIAVSPQASCDVLRHTSSVLLPAHLSSTSPGGVQVEVEQSKCSSEPTCTSDASRVLEAYNSRL